MIFSTSWLAYRMYLFKQMPWYWISTAGTSLGSLQKINLRCAWSLWKLVAARNFHALCSFSMRYNFVSLYFFVQPQTIQISLACGDTVPFWGSCYTGTKIVTTFFHDSIFWLTCVAHIFLSCSSYITEVTWM